MRSLISILTLCLGLLVAAPANAQPQSTDTPDGSASAPVLKAWPLGTLIDQQSMDVARSFQFVDTAGSTLRFNLLVVLVNYSTSANPGDITMTCTASDDNNVTDYVIQSVTPASGVGTSDDASLVKTVAAAAKWPWRVDITGFFDIECSFTHSAGAAGDIFSVRGYLTTM